MRTLIERASSADLMQMAGDTRSSPAHIAAVLMLDASFTAELPVVREALAERVRSIPRFRQHLVRTPIGCGRPVWVDDAKFDIGRHVAQVHCAAPGDQRALLHVVAEVITTPLPRDRSPWTATLVTGLGGGQTALILVVHHGLADGIGGLAVLARLVDGAPVVPATAQSPRPRVRELVLDTFRSRLRAMARLPASVRVLKDAVTEIGSNGMVQAPASSQNRPIGTSRSLAVVRTDLDAVREIAHACEATVNDVILTAVTGALRALLNDRGETVDTLVVSIPASTRRRTDATHLGNHVSAIPLELPAGGSSLTRLEATTRVTRAHKAGATGASYTLFEPMSRVLAWLGLYDGFIRRQRLMNTVVTDLPGPRAQMSFLGAPITEIVPTSTIIGNVTAGFAALSYAGSLVITVVADPVTCPDLPVLRQYLHAELDTLTCR